MYDASLQIHFVSFICFIFERQNHSESFYFINNCSGSVLFLIFVRRNACFVKQVSG